MAELLSEEEFYDSDILAAFNEVETYEKWVAYRTRLRALKLSISIDDGMPPAHLVSRAQLFETYLSGETK